MVSAASTNGLNLHIIVTKCAKCSHCRHCIASIGLLRSSCWNNPMFMASNTMRHMAGIKVHYCVVVCCICPEQFAIYKGWSKAVLIASRIARHLCMCAKPVL